MTINLLKPEQDIDLISYKMVNIIPLIGSTGNNDNFSSMLYQKNINLEAISKIQVYIFNISKVTFYRTNCVSF